MPNTQYYRDEKSGAIINPTRALTTLPGGAKPGPDKDKLFRELYAAMMQQELEHRESAALVASKGEHAYDKPLSGGQRKRCRRMARRLAQAHVTSPPSPKKRVCSRKPRKDPKQRAAYYQAMDLTPEGNVVFAAYHGGRGHASTAGFKHSTREAAEREFLKSLVETTEPSLVARALNAGYSGPLPEDLDDEAVSSQKPGLFAKLWNLRKVFG